MYRTDGDQNDDVLYEAETVHGPYQVVDMIYDGRPARVLFSGDRLAAQSGVATDDKPELLFDYNQRFFELVTSLKPHSLLLIGGGAFTLPMALRAAFPDLGITVVEINPELPAIATRFFGFQTDDRLKVVHADGRQFLETSESTYDVILLDAFSGTTMPPQLMSVEAGQLYASHLTENGVVAANIISSYYGERIKPLERLWGSYESALRHVRAYPASKTLLSYWLPQNFVLVGYNGRAPHIELRYEPMEPLHVSLAQRVHDADIALQ